MEPFLIWVRITCTFFLQVGMSNLETAKKVSEGYRMDPPRNTPREIATLMKECWAQNPEERPNFKTISELLMNLSNVLLPTKNKNVNEEPTWKLATDTGFYEITNAN